MKRRKAFGLSGILILSATFAGLVLSCYTGDAEIRPYAYISGDSLIVLEAHDHDSYYDYRNSYTLVVTLRPRMALHGAEIEWSSGDEGVVFVKEDTRRPLSGFGENGRATVMVVGYSEGTARITATITFEDRAFPDIVLTVDVSVGPPGPGAGPEPGGPGQEDNPEEPGQLSIAIPELFS